MPLYAQRRILPCQSYTYLVVSRFKNELLGLYPVYVRASIMPKSKAFSSRGLRCGVPYRFPSGHLTDDTTARFH